MKFNRYNKEGYPDPTPYEAFTKMEAERKARAPAVSAKRWRPLVYICSPLSGDFDANQEAARRYCRYAVDSGYVPIAPHLFFPQFMDDNNKKERNLAMFMDIVLLTKCAELWVFGETISNGMSIEIEKAKRKSKPIRFFTTTCEEVSK